ncbi:CPBP family glutamic-type intramembrane protease [Kineosporia sp. NBRC 101677]
MNGAIGATVLGLLLGRLYTTTKSLILPVYVHVVVDTAILLNIR